MQYIRINIQLKRKGDGMGDEKKGCLLYTSQSSAYFHGCNRGSVVSSLSVSYTHLSVMYLYRRNTCKQKKYL